jgi:hypothetical protein
MKNQAPDRAICDQGLWFSAAAFGVTFSVIQSYACYNGFSNLILNTPSSEHARRRSQNLKAIGCCATFS